MLPLLFIKIKFALMNSKVLSAKNMAMQGRPQNRCQVALATSNLPSTMVRTSLLLLDCVVFALSRVWLSHSLPTLVGGEAT